MDQLMQGRVINFLVLTFASAMLMAADPASQPTTAPTRLTAFSSNEFRFRLDYPSEWTVLEHPVNNQVFSMQTEPATASDRNLGVMGLRIETGPGEGNDAEILKDISGGMVEHIFNHGGKRTLIKPDKLGDIPARRIRFDTEQPTGTTTAIYIVAVHHGTEYVFAIAAPADQMGKMLPGIQAVLKSFRVLE